MSLLLYTDDRIIYDDGQKGAVQSILIPKYSRIKKYADITSPNDNNVRDRHGDADDLPALWRQDGPYVYVYGNISLELDEKRQTHNMYLPQDFVGDNVGAFYFIFSGKFVVHGVKTVTDDGHKIWGTSLISSTEGESIDAVVSSISERMLEAKEEEIVVAVHDNEDVLGQFKEALEPFEQEVVTFSSLGKPHKSIKPLFNRKDRSLLMIIISLCAFIGLCWVIFLWATAQIELKSLEEKTVDLKNAIRIMQKNKVLGHITNPKDFLRVMDQTLPAPPSTLLHSPGVIGAQFGELRSIVVGNAGKSRKKRRRGKGRSSALPKGVINVKVDVNIPANNMLLDQERTAKSIVESTPWIQSIDRPSGGNTLNLRVKVK